MDVSEIIEAIAAIYEEVLDRDGVRADDGFFDLGGHSILAAGVVACIEEDFGIEVPLRTLFEHQTPRLLAECIEPMLSSSAADSGSSKRAEATAHDADSTYPLSAGQQRMWFLDQFDDSGQYNMPAARILRGELDVDALSKALCSVVSRHEMLRTVYGDEEGVPYQKVLASPDDWPLPVHALEGLDSAERERELTKIYAEEESAKIDLATGPMFKTKLVRCSPTEHVLFVTSHHIAVDGISIDVIWSDLAAFYAAYRSGNEPDLPPLTMTYIDYAKWEQEQLAHGVANEEVAYWKAQLADLPAEDTRLPFEKDSGKGEASANYEVQVEVPKVLADRCRSFVAAHNGTIFMAMASMIRLVLFHYTRQHDLCIGVPVNNRSRNELKNVVGMFTNFVLLRSPLKTASDTFEDVFGREREASIGALSHQQMGFETVINKIGLGRRARGKAHLYIATYAHSWLFAMKPLAGLEVVEFQPSFGAAKHDIDIESWDREDGGITLSFYYNSASLQQHDIEALGSKLVEIASAAMENPGAPIESFV